MLRPLRSALVFAASVVPVLLRDFIGIAGIGLMSFGAWLHYRPLGFVVAGAALVGVAWLKARADRQASDGKTNA